LLPKISVKLDGGISDSFWIGYLRIISSALEILALHAIFVVGKVSLETVVSKLRQFVGAIHRLVPDENRRVAFLIAVLAGLHVEHELAERAVQAGHVSTQEGEAGT